MHDAMRRHWCEKQSTRVVSQRWHWEKWQYPHSGIQAALRPPADSQHISTAVRSHRWSIYKFPCWLHAFSKQISFICFCWHCVFVAELGLFSSCAEQGYSLVAVLGLLICSGFFILQSTGSVAHGLQQLWHECSWVVVPRLWSRLNSCGTPAATAP